MKSGESSFATVAAFAMALLHPRLGTGIVLILVIFILLDRDHISDAVVRLVGSSNVHATSEALEDAANRVGRVLLLQVLTNFGFAIAVSAGLFAFGTPNAILWGLLAGMLRFIPYVGAAIGAILPTLISFAVFPGWLQPLLVQPYQQIYRRLIRRAASEGSAVALAQIEEKGKELGLDDSLGRMVVLPEEDRSADRLSPEQVDAIVDGTDLVIDFLDEKPDEDSAAREPTTTPEAPPIHPGVFVRCVGGRGQIDDAAASIIAFGLRQSGMDALGTRHTETVPAAAAALTIDLICYASHPSDAVWRYTTRKARREGQSSVRHAVIEFDVAPSRTRGKSRAERSDVLAGSIAAICRLVSQTASEVSEPGQDVVVAAPPVSGPRPGA